MTGRRLYDHHCDAHRAHVQTTYAGGLWTPTEVLPAWPYLSRRAQQQWNTFARAITPKRKAVRS